MSEQQRLKFAARAAGHAGPEWRTRLSPRDRLPAGSKRISTRDNHRSDILARSRTFLGALCLARCYALAGGVDGFVLQFKYGD